ncbi:MAG: pyridoxal phosphate-dependent aminotransferase [Furfurilactobacillus sp.]|jgi:cystathionine beta-lyase|uniref:cysteine-S-conjugate beta-lyase n=1 Tax=Furfurilactobacillus milii TaxID=2888272 RepID=A0ABT6DBC3_9LACO|nr:MULTISPECIES: MalY/PatB family protein [Furfurilactobacillus]QLE66781.1 Aspartate aminotransferase [Furfurilactobacillus rossiae]MCF6160666.1 pyridoxal phosphate-dependent aminotransferase [Furfurilactobacillus milii]MCF6162898.1 pyridoxal phosphate-dependent aminotransferase [Furfurilactobacillus milii]MCF6420182.1 pyridoxal phosphate-dependent aminotransferase [Furfurilactobacillus milii]MCH4010452.1 pyridoxal phosphate-dependent aminotransferase [Furfurilactobacillus sp.]
MTYDFTTVPNRRHTNSVKWDVADNELPMWVADMDFQTAPEIKATLADKVAKGIFGYSIIPDNYYQVVADWWRKRHGFAVQTDWILFCSGVVPAISSTVRRMTNPGEQVLVQAPVYNIFYNSIINNGRRQISSDLVYENGQYHIDFDDLEAKLADPLTTMMILCNPANPVGKVWSRETLQQIGELCLKHHVLVLSDEIHCDIVTDPTVQYTPFASISSDLANNSITCVSPTKTFNLAGVQTSSMIIPNPAIRERIDRGINNDEIAEPNIFAIDAAVTAFTKGEPWLNELLKQLAANKRSVTTFLSNELPEVTVASGAATYLMWLDVSAVANDSVALCNFIRQKTGLFLSDGVEYGGNGNLFVRMNVACPDAELQDGLERLKRGIKAFLAQK